MTALPDVLTSLAGYDFDNRSIHLDALTKADLAVGMLCTVVETGFGPQQMDGWDNLHAVLTAVYATGKTDTIARAAKAARGGTRLDKLRTAFSEYANSRPDNVIIATARGRLVALGTDGDPFAAEILTALHAALTSQEDPA